MSHVVTVRPTRDLERAIGNQEPFVIPEECVNNSIVIRTLLENFGSKVWTGLTNATDRDLDIISESVAYLMRPDSLIGNMHYLVPQRMPETRVSKFRQYIKSTSGKIIHLKNDPSILSPSFDLPFESEEHLRGAELYRCYGAVLSWSPDSTKRRLEYEQNSGGPAFSLADMTAYLLCPTDLTEYKYDSQTLANFNEELARDLAEE